MVAACFALVACGGEQPAEDKKADEAAAVEQTCECTEECCAEEVCTEECCAEEATIAEVAQEAAEEVAAEAAAEAIKNL